MDSKTIVITGASDGIGAAAARQLKAAGHNVIVVGRTKEKTERIATELGVPYHLVDYSDLSSVVRLAQELRAYDRIDVLCNNAGGLMNEKVITVDGVERTFQVNVLAPYLLTRLLADKLCQDNATVIQTSSIASNLFGKKFDINDIQTVQNYTSTSAYGNAKLCDALLTRAFHAHYGAKGMHAVAFEPGVVRSNFASEANPLFNWAFHSCLKYLFTITPQKSCKRMVRLALGTPDVDFQEGATYSYTKLYPIKYKDDGTAVKRLWEQCEQLVKHLLPTT